MKKRVILIDGNNLLFRSYYATAYANNFMNNSKGFPTNGLYGLVNMLNKIINEEKPEYVMCAFDKGSNFRREMYDDYKAGRITTPDNLKKQFPVAKKLCDYMGIKYIECDNYEADDIIGTFARMADEDKNYNATIISSDKDLLQLISDEVDVKLLKQKDYILMNEQTFFEHYGIKPIRMIDLKALMGDPSDNIPGVKGIGEKTALSLLVKYDTLENLYNHLDELTPKTKEKLLNDKESAFFSYKLATIYKTIDFDYTFESIKYNGPDYSNLINLYKELEFNSFLKTIPSMKNEDGKVVYEKVEGKLNLDDKNYSTYIECDNSNYNLGKIIGASIYDGNKLYYFDLPSLILNKDLFSDSMVTFDLKKNIVLLNDFKTNTIFDTMVAAYLLNLQIKEDLAVLMNKEDIDVPFYEDAIKDEEKLKIAVTMKAKYIYETRDDLIKKLKLEDMYDLFNNIEMPLIPVLARMEINGIKCEKSVLDELHEETLDKLNELSDKIYERAGEKFNISSPKQLGVILFEKLGFPYHKRVIAGKKYSTDAGTLEKLIGIDPIIEYILEYRNLAKFNSTYLESLHNYILSDGKIHTIYKQTLTRTGRLSSMDPNMQNIPTRDENGRRVRKAFVPCNDMFLCADYSQIELRVLAHISDSKELIEAFKSGEDIHTTVASDIFEVPKSEVTKQMRRTAKAVIFGIVYGISGFGLGENLNLNPKEAKKFIDKYLDLYPGVKRYMDEIVEEAHMFGSVRTLFGRKREIEELQNSNYMIRNAGERIALNTPIQGTSADIIKMAMIKIDKIMEEKNLKSKMLLQVHDELIFDVKEEEKEIISEIVKNEMENITPLKVPLKVGMDYGKNWYDAK